MTDSQTFALDLALSHWRDWDADLDRCPEVADKLSNGLANQCWKVLGNEQAFVVRLGSPLVTNMHCTWEQELRATIAGGHLGIAPRVIYSDPQSRTMVLEWGGVTAAPSDLQSEVLLLQLADTLAQLHQATTALTTPGYVSTLELYLRLIPAHIGFRPDKEMVSFARYLDMDSQVHVFCHHDLSIGNLLIDEPGIKLIDWEYARRGNSLFDLGSLVESLRLDSAQTRLLLERYQAPESHYADIADMQLFIRYLGSLWETAMRAMRHSTQEC